MGVVASSIITDWVWPLFMITQNAAIDPSDPSSTPHQFIAKILHPNPNYNPALSNSANEMAKAQEFLPASTVTVRLQATEGVMYPSEEELREFLKDGFVPGKEEIRSFLGGQEIDIITVQESARATGAV